MSANSKKSMGWMIVLILLGMAALYGWIEVAEPAHSRGDIGVVHRKTRSWNWPELTARLTIKACHS